jgi:hypothetical protein
MRVSKRLEDAAGWYARHTSNSPQTITVYAYCVGLRS